MSDREKGLYKKYEVRRIDGKEKHDGCEYFVLDMVHDKFSVPALSAYAHACKQEYPELAKDLWSWIGRQNLGRWVEVSREL